MCLKLSVIRMQYSTLALFGALMILFTVVKMFYDKILKIVIAKRCEVQKGVEYLK